MKKYALKLLVKTGAVLLGLLASSAQGQNLPAPNRPANAPSGSAFLKRAASMDFPAREAEIISQITAGNVPNFLRKLSPVEITNVFDGRTNHATIFVTPDYLAIGADEDYYLAHMSPNTAQRIADAFGCSLPTRKMVDEIYRAAAVKLIPEPVTPGPTMTTVPVFSNHNAIVRAQRKTKLSEHPLGELTAGHQKDVVIATGLASSPGKVAIYGWHKPDGKPIQPLYLKHAAAWVDYSQCIRLVHNKLIVNGKESTVQEVLADVELSGLLSDEGSMSDPRYPTNALAGLPMVKAVESKSPKSVAATNSPLASNSNSVAPTFFEGFKAGKNYGERLASFAPAPEVKVHINAPEENAFRNKKTLLIFFALPNGSTTEQTIGRISWPGDDWHFDIQHIGAQTRFLRKLIPERAVVLAYLESGMKSWPAWRKKYGDKMIPEILRSVTGIFSTNDLELVLTGHSGGGSFTFGYLNQVEAIPKDIVRIAFLDSNYAYDAALGHKDKFVSWLRDGPNHYLSVLAYNDAIALLDGKPFVSAAGGTWGKSHAMLNDLGGEFRFETVTHGDLEWWHALEGRIQFVLKQNPERKIYHTVQVERNGFIHAMVSGTQKENQGYEYFKDRAYSKWVTEGE